MMNGITFFVKEVESEDSRRVASLIHEKQLLEKLSHPGIVKVYDLFEEDGFHYLVQQYIEGESLDKVISPLPDVFIQERILQDWAVQLYDIFSYLHGHDQPVIFRDLKPSNIIRDPPGRIHLVDFGIARFYAEGKGRDTEAMGSALTASPEHYGRGQTDIRSDIFTIGATLHFIATNGKGRSEVPFEFAPVRSINPRLSPLFENIIKKALELDPAQRFQSVQEMRKAHVIKPSLENSAGPVPTAQVPEQKERKSLPINFSTCAIFALSLITLVLGGFVLQNTLKRQGTVGEEPYHAINSPVNGDSTLRISSDRWPEPGKYPKIPVTTPRIAATGTMPGSLAQGSPPVDDTVRPAGNPSPSPTRTMVSDRAGTGNARMPSPEEPSTPVSAAPSPAPAPDDSHSPLTSIPAGTPSPVYTAPDRGDDGVTLRPASPEPDPGGMAVRQGHPALPASMPQVGTVVDGDVLVAEFGFHVRIPGYRRDSPRHEEIPDPDTSVLSFSKTSGRDERFLKVIICKAPMTITSRHVRNIYYNRIRGTGAREIEPLTESQGFHRGVFSMNFMNGRPYTCEQRLKVNGEGRLLFILMAGAPVDQFNEYRDSEFTTFFHSFTEM
jgi:serine/threonine protein kinase